MIHLQLPNQNERMEYPYVGRHDGRYYLVLSPYKAMQLHDGAHTSPGHIWDTTTEKFEYVPDARVIIQNKPQ